MLVDERAREHVTFAQADTVDVADDDGLGRERSEPGVGNIALPSVRRDDRCCSAQRWAGMLFRLGAGVSTVMGAADALAGAERTTIDRRGRP